MNKKSFSKIIELGNETQTKMRDLIKKQYAKIKLDLFDPSTDEITNGLFGRNFRLISSFLMHPSYWVADIGEIILRSMLETNIYLLFLIKKNEKDLFLEFKKYGIGQEKKYKAKMTEYLNNGTLKLENQPEGFIDYLNSETDKEISDELVNIQLKNFENLRELSEEVGLKFEYDSIYEPASSIVHGHYNALTLYYLDPCEDPLHRHHYIPNFDIPPINISLIRSALKQFFLSYDAWRKYYEFDDRLTNIIENYLKSLLDILEDNKK